MYYRPIPLVVLAQVPVLAAQVTNQPVNVRITSFPGDDLGTLYGLDVDYNPRAVQVKDGRKSDYVISERVTIFLRADGSEADERQHESRHRLGNITISEGVPYEVVTESKLEQEMREEERALAARMYGPQGS
ncbi:hypothetical protein [Candidatus Solirubrobacter pratensis]|uniref:hypothetical protein n=1 Tax=Candidatus Solirubrobacter pratensis TaxID=1298857 RepID=UPI0003FB3A75|nr:hypothetical protein [Candidatus Solirubrobacter pratensis]